MRVNYIFIFILLILIAENMSLVKCFSICFEPENMVSKVYFISGFLTTLVIFTTEKDYSHVYQPQRGSQHRCA